MATDTHYCTQYRYTKVVKPDDFFSVSSNTKTLFFFLNETFRLSMASRSLNYRQQPEPSIVFAEVLSKTVLSPKFNNETLADLFLAFVYFDG